MVFQNYALYPDKTVFENMGFGLTMRNVARKEIEDRVRRAAEILRIEPLLGRRPAQLSGGQRQRVAVGRVIVRDPKVFLFDEPLSNLDAHLRVAMRKELIKLHRRLRATMVYVTHDQVEAMTMGDVIVVMRDGKIQQHGPPLEVFNRPANVFVASFIGAPPMNMLSGSLGSHEDRLVFRAGPNSVPLPPAMGRALGHAAGREVVFGIRPQDLAVQRELEQDSTGLGGEIVLVERLGTETHVDVDIGGLSVQASLPPTTDLTEGQRVRVSLDFTKGPCLRCGGGWSPLPRHRLTAELRPPTCRLQTEITSSRSIATRGTTMRWPSSMPMRACAWSASRRPSAINPWIGRRATPLASAPWPACPFPSPPARPGPCRARSWTPPTSMAQQGWTERSCRLPTATRSTGARRSSSSTSPGNRPASWSSSPRDR